LPEPPLPASGLLIAMVKLFSNVIDVERRL
jgi:hypothetical protein